MCGAPGVGWVFVTSGRILVRSSLLGRADCHTFNLPPSAGVRVWDGSHLRPPHCRAGRVWYLVVDDLDAPLGEELLRVAEWHPVVVSLKRYALCLGDVLNAAESRVLCDQFRESRAVQERVRAEEAIEALLFAWSLWRRRLLLSPGVFLSTSLWRVCLFMCVCVCVRVRSGCPYGRGCRHLDVRIVSARACGLWMYARLVGARRVLPLERFVEVG